MRYFTVTCDKCDEEATVVIESDDLEPEYCSLCGNDAYAELVDEDDK
jgi:hypothetical protein